MISVSYVIISGQGLGLKFAILQIREMSYSALFQTLRPTSGGATQTLQLQR